MLGDPTSPQSGVCRSPLTVAAVTSVSWEISASARVGSDRKTPRSAPSWHQLVPVWERPVGFSGVLGSKRLRRENKGANLFFLLKTGREEVCWNGKISLRMCLRASRHAQWCLRLPKLGPTSFLARYWPWEAWGFYDGIGGMIGRVVRRYIWNHRPQAPASQLQAMPMYMLAAPLPTLVTEGIVRRH